MSWQLSILVFRDPDQPFNAIIKTILASKLDKDAYEVIFVGSMNGAKDNNKFTHAVVNKERPLVRAFYDNYISVNAVRLNSMVKEAHCSMVLIWPGLCFLKNNFRPIPDDVVNCEYYLMLWLRFNQASEDWPWWFDGKGLKAEHSFGRMKYKANVKDTLRFIYCLDKLSFICKVWYFGWLLRAIGRSLIRRK